METVYACWLVVGESSHLSILHPAVDNEAIEDTEE